MKNVLVISLLAFAAQVGAQSTTTGSTGSATASTGASSPAQTCTQIVDAAKANNYEQVASLMAMPDHKKDKMAKKTKTKFSNMHKDYLTEIQNMTCGDEQVAGDRAMVVAQSQSDKRLIPFIQHEGQWKFDMRTYKAFYMDDKKGSKHKTM